MDWCKETAHGRCCQLFATATTSAQNAQNAIGLLCPTEIPYWDKNCHCLHKGRTLNDFITRTAIAKFPMLLMGY